MAVLRAPAGSVTSDRQFEMASPAVLRDRAISQAADMELEAACFELGRAALAGGAGALAELLQRQACGALRRQAFLAGLRACADAELLPSGQQQQLSPVQARAWQQAAAAVQLVGSLVQHGLFGLQLLQVRLLQQHLLLPLHTATCC